MKTVNTKYSKIYLNDDNTVNKFILNNKLKRMFKNTYFIWTGEENDINSMNGSEFKASVPLSQVSKNFIQSAGIINDSDYLKIVLDYFLEVEIVFEKENRGGVEHIEKLPITFTGTIYPIPQKVAQKIESYITAKKLEYLFAPDESKNKKTFREVRYLATAL